MNLVKPLGRKAYGSIPHLPGSRMGPGDHHCDPGQATIACEKARKRDRVIVTEKLDGACVAIANIQGVIEPIGRAGWPATSSDHEHIRMFGLWVIENAPTFEALPENHRIVGEWLAMAHGTRYEVRDEPFVGFDVMVEDRRLPFDEAQAIIRACFLPTAYVISDGPAIDIATALDRLGDYGYHGALEQIEGAVWRVETEGKCNFLVKYVRPNKIDGKYFPQYNDGKTVWNWRQW